jgi:hypothetical protein
MLREVMFFADFAKSAKLLATSLRENQRFVTCEAKSLGASQTSRSAKRSHYPYGDINFASQTRSQEPGEGAKDAAPFTASM